MCDGFSEAGVALGATGAATTAATAGATAATAATVGTAATAVGAGATAATAATGILGTGITAGQLLTGLQVVSALAGLTGARMTQEAGNKAADKQTLQALQARADNANQVNLEVIQAHDAASQKINSNNLAAREASGTALAASDGIGGLSVDAMLGDIAGKSAKYDSSVADNLSATNAQLDNQMRNVNTTANNIINQERIAPPPDYLGTSLKIGGDIATYMKNRGG